MIYKGLLTSFKSETINLNYIYTHLYTQMITDMLPIYCASLIKLIQTTLCPALLTDLPAIYWINKTSQELN